MPMVANAALVFKVSTLKVVTKETEDSEKVVAKRARKGRTKKSRYSTNDSMELERPFLFD